MRLACSALLLTFASPLHAQELPATDSLGTYGRIVQSWTGLRVAPGREAYAMLRIREQVNGWLPAALGSIVKTQGEGSPHRVIACGLDEPSYVVSSITDEGFLRVHVAGSRPRGAMWDAMHMGQRIIVLTTDRGDPSRVRAVSGVFGVRSTHLWRRSPGTMEAPPTLEDLWIDVGARNRAEVSAMGIRLLDPVFRDTPDWSVGDAVVGPAVAAKAGCAAVVGASEQTPRTGRTTFVVSAQSSFGWVGLSAVLARLSDVDEVYVVSPDSQRVGKSIRVRTQFPGTLVEIVSEEDLRALFEEVYRAAGVTGDANPRRLRLSSASLRGAQPTDSLTRYAELLARLTDTYGASGDEGDVRMVIQARLPSWARDLATSDTSRNLILAMGPDRDTVVFIAHMDEVGFQVTQQRSGVVALRQLGGFYPWLWAGQPALLHHDMGTGASGTQGCRPTSGTAMRGVFLPPDTSARSPRDVQAWFGEQLAHAGDTSDAAGFPVTGFKCATRLGTTRFTARSIDDRLGSAALIMALDGIDPAKLAHKVIFIWSVREETGLDGAHAAAAAFGPSVRRVHAVDTFVSADSPLETGRFAVVPIGTGAVVRALDNSTVVPPDEIERVIRIARSAGVPLQVSMTNGGTDGRPFSAFGAVNVPVSWPLRYSHSPAEVIDLRDMRSLVRLVTALALAPVR